MGHRQAIPTFRHIDWGEYRRGTRRGKLGGFFHKYGIAEKEARETAYWLALMEKAELLPAKRLTEIQKETDELIAIIVSIDVNAKRRPR